MRLEKQNILMFLRAPQHGGTENVVLQLCEIFKPLVNKIVVVSADGFAVEQLNALGIKHYAIPDIESKSVVTMAKVSKELIEIVKKERITVIHTHHRMAAFYVRLLGLYKKCYFINTSHNTFYNKKLLTRFAYKKANLIACGKMVKRNLNKTYGLNNVKVIYNGVKPFTGTVVEDDEISFDRKKGYYLIGNIGRLSEQKGMEYYVKSVPGVIKNHPNVKFYIIGSGEKEKELKIMSKQLPIQFLGYRNDIQNIMSQLDLVVLSSLWEGLPLTPIEAFSVGKTIVATGVDGTLEIVKNRENGVLVNAKDPKSLAQGINWIIEHPKKQKTMEMQAKDTFQNRFSFEIFKQSYIKYYKNL